MVCPFQAFPWFWNVSAVIVLFSVAKIWDRYVLLCILASGLLQKQSGAQAWRFGRECPLCVGDFLLCPNWTSYRCLKFFLALAQYDGACRCSLVWLMLIVNCVLDRAIMPYSEKSAH